jgi:hypothetical protein
MFFGVILVIIINANSQYIYLNYCLYPYFLSLKCSNME